MNMLRRAQAPSRPSAIRPSQHCAGPRSSPPMRPACESKEATPTTGCFAAPEAVVHQAAPTRGAVVVRTLMDGNRPTSGVPIAMPRNRARKCTSDLPGTSRPRRRPIRTRQVRTCCPPRLKRWLQRAFVSKSSARRPSQASVAPWSEISTISSLPQLVRSGPRHPKQVQASSPSTVGLCPVARNGRRDEQRMRTRPQTSRRSTEDHQRLSRHVGRPGRADIRTVVDTARLAPGTNPFKIILQIVSASNPP